MNWRKLAVLFGLLSEACACRDSHVRVGHVDVIDPGVDVPLMAIWLSDVPPDGTGPALAVGGSGTVAFSENADGQWRRIPTGVGADLLGVSGFQMPTGEISFLAVGGGGTVVSSLGGIVWEEVDVPTDRTLNAVTVLASGLVIAAGDGVILMSSNRDAEWSSHEISGNARAIWVWSDEEFWVAGDRGFVSVTADSGASWRTPVLDWRRDFSSVWGISTADDAYDIYVAGSAGFVARTRDLGESWQNLLVDSTSAVVGQGAWLGDETGGILRLAEGGLVYDKVYELEGLTITDSQFTVLERTSSSEVNESVWFATREGFVVHATATASNDCEG